MGYLLGLKKYNEEDFIKYKISYENEINKALSYNNRSLYRPHAIIIASIIFKHALILNYFICVIFIFMLIFSFNVFNMKYHIFKYKNNIEYKECCINYVSKFYKLILKHIKISVILFVLKIYIQVYM